MKRSKAITLVLLTGTLLLPACSDEENLRNKYASWDDCVADYKDPSKCARSEERTGTMTRYFYYGPWYSASRFRNSSYNPGYESGRSVGVARGGFGDRGICRGRKDMRRIKLGRMRDNWQKRVEDIGFYYYEMDGSPYWDESAYYEFTSGQIDHLEEVTDDLYGKCKKLVEYVFQNNLGERMGIPGPFFEFARDSWRDREPTIYGRFDFWWDGVSDPKLLEFNADTPTALFEASVVQYYWLQDMFPGKDQFNSIHEKLLDVLGGKIRRYCSYETFYTSSVRENLEDLTTTEYLRDVATQSGLKTEHVYVDDIGYDHNNRYFVDLEERRIRCMFKLYPWEWMICEEFGPHLLEKGLALLEPAWKMVLSNKAILPILWEMYPGHKNLLPSYFEPPSNGVTYVEKPFFSREGENIVVRPHFNRAKPLSVYQEYRQLPEYSGNYPVIGSWVIDEMAAGIGIREDMSPITNNMSRFVPHAFDN